MDTRSTTIPAASRPRLVIADDDPLIQSMLDASLAGEFEIVGMAGDGDQAIELARANQPDAALLDVRMPRGGGLHAVRGIREVAPATAIVMLSGDRTHGLVDELIRAGAIAYRRKGASPQALAGALRESIKAHTAEHSGSTWSILAFYCLGLDRAARRRTRPN
jgi:DNA-binding NarL/FixJ family response regulator